jgi:hypothetical protein
MSLCPNGIQKRISEYAVCNDSVYELWLWRVGDGVGLAHATPTAQPCLLDIKDTFKEEYMKLAFVTKKIYPNNDKTIIIKKGYLPNQEKIKKTKWINKLKKNNAYKNLENKFSGQLSFGDLEKYEHAKQELDKKYLPTLETISRSANRRKKELWDILACNDFDYSVTLTFAPNEIERLDDTKTRKAFSQWANYIKKQYPNMRYVSVPEYHKKGGLHYHLLVGSITENELGLIDSNHKTKSGETVFNITKWSLGFSTATKIIDPDKTKSYIAKYITKGEFDLRFFRKRRFYASHNINRPIIEKRQFPDYLHIPENSIDMTEYTVEYQDEEKEYLVLTTKEIKDKNEETLFVSPNF